MNFDAACAYLTALINEHQSRRQPNRLERFRVFLHELGDPHARYPSVHVAGTSGKGSTATIAAEILRAGGLHVGLHTKPHLRSVTERALVDGAAVSQERFAELMTAMMPAIERTTAEVGRPTYYETLLALAFVAFAEAEVDVAVIEAGIGGMLDGTNVLVPRVSVITNVGLDHVEILGPTIADIALDKAGIAKPGVPLLTDAREPSARSEIEGYCAKAGAPFHALEDEVTIEPRAGARAGQSFAVTTPLDRYEIEMPLLGGFQRRNAATAIRALELAEGLRPSRAQVETGLARVEIPGRMEVHATRPVVIFDVAHNPDKAASLVGALAETFPERRFTFVVAITDGKDAQAIIAPFLELRGGFICTSFEGVAGRPAMRPQRLASIASEMGFWARAIADPVDAFSVARRNAGPDDVIVVTGSTFVVAELRAWWYDNAVATAG